MNFFGGSNGCGCTDKSVSGGSVFGGDSCSLIFLILILQSCCGGCGMSGINVDCGTILLLLLLTNCSSCGK